jgi:hypothetical protein
LLLPLLLLCLGAVHPAAARVVGMVVDDSGSMTPSFNQALFAAQLLISTLREDDRLFVVRLNAGTSIDAVSAAERSGYMQRMRQDWRFGQRTPYAPLARMLEHVVEVTEPGEDADLLVFADGNFQGVPANVSASFEALKARFRGARLQVHFVKLPGEQAQIDLRGPLLRVFNGSPTAGARDIDSPAEVFAGLAEVIARMAGADALASDALVRRSGSTVSFKLPFAVRRVVVVTTGDDDNAPAQWRSASFALPATPPLEYAPAMGRVDPGVASRLQARVVHLSPAQPLPAGAEQRLEFDRPLARGDRILFDADLKIDLAVRDTDGDLLVREPSGRLRVAVGQRIRVHARFMDRDGSGWTPLVIGDTGLRPEFSLSDGDASRPMPVDRRPAPRALRSGRIKRRGGTPSASRAGSRGSSTCVRTTCRSTWFPSRPSSPRWRPGRCNPARIARPASSGCR